MKSYLLPLPILILACSVPAVQNTTDHDGQSERYAQSDVSVRFTDPAGAFGVVFPNKPSLTEKTLRIEGIDIPVKLYKANSDLGMFTVTYSDYPPELVNLANYEAMLDGAVDNSLASSTAVLLTQEKIQLNGRHGRKVLSKAVVGETTTMLSSLFFLDDYRMYIVAVVASPDNLYDNQVSEFFDSFKIIKTVAPSIAEANEASAPVSSGFDEYHIKNFGTIKVPDMLELQNKRLRETAVQYAQKIGVLYVTGNEVVFQQKGLNDQTPEGKASYVRLMVETVVDPDAQKYDRTLLNNMSPADLAEFEMEVKNGLVVQFQKQNIKLLAWYGAALDRVGGINSIHSSYLRQFGDKPPVLVDQYLVFNGNRLHTITVSFRAEEKARNGPRFQKAIGSIQFD